MPADRRIRASARTRLVAVQVLYAQAINIKTINTKAINTKQHNDLFETLAIENNLSAMACTRAQAIVTHSTRFDDKIRATLDEKWAFDRLEVIVRVILQAATFELYTTDASPKTLVSDYIAMAGAFDLGPGIGLINAVLQRLIDDKIENKTENIDQK
ncbi:MAG: transcription antitermination factor NusB [Pseudomonadota bacterium]